MKKTDVQFLTLTLVTMCITAAAVASAAELKTPVGMTVWLRDNHGVSLFFDTTLTGWTADELVASLRGIRPEMFVVEAQLIHGAQYPTALKRGASAGKSSDDLARAREVARRLGAKWFAYLPVDSATPEVIQKYPEWAWLDADGKIKEWAPHANSRMICMRPNREHKGYLYEQHLPQLEEIIAKYDPDGFWFDGDIGIETLQCWCPNCLKEWQADTGLEAPRSADSPHWQRWVEWNFQRHRAGVAVVAEAIRKANPRTVAMFNWLWARSPEPAPAFVDAITGDNVGGVDTFLSVGQRLGAQQDKPWELVSYFVPEARALEKYSHQRTMQEGALTMAFGGRWNLWGFGGSSAVQFEFTQMASQFHAFREAALGPSVSLAHIAVLDSETTWARTGRPAVTPATRAAKALGEAGYCTDLVNEKTLRQNLTPYRAVVLPGCAFVEAETLEWLKAFAEKGGIVLALGSALRGDGEADETRVREMLGLARSLRGEQRSALAIGRRPSDMSGLWQVEPTGAAVLERFADGTPALTMQQIGTGRVGFLASNQLPYPDDGLFAGLLRRLGLGPSFQVLDAPPDMATLCTLRTRGQQTILHVVDLSTRRDGRPRDFEYEGLTDWNPVRNTTVVLAADALPLKTSVVPKGVRADTSLKDGRLHIQLRNWHTHAAVVLDFPPGTTVGTLPSDTALPPDAFHPDRGQPFCFADGFEQPLGEPPMTPWQLDCGQGTSIRTVEDPAGADNRCLEFVDGEVSDPVYAYRPCLWRHTPDCRRVRLSLDLRVPAGQSCVVELRRLDEGTQYTGAGLKVDDKGSVEAMGATPRPLTPVTPGQWFRVEVTTGSGPQGQCFDVTVAAPGAAEQRFTDLPLASRRFADEGCNHIVIYGLGQQVGSFRVDNVRFRALVSEDAGKQ